MTENPITTAKGLIHLSSCCLLQESRSARADAEVLLLPRRGKTVIAYMNRVVGQAFEQIVASPQDPDASAQVVSLMMSVVVTSVRRFEHSPDSSISTRRLAAITPCWSTSCRIVVSPIISANS